MWSDPIVDEVRRVRDEHAHALNYDVAAIFSALRELEARSSVPLVRRSPRPAVKRQIVAPPSDLGSAAQHSAAAPPVG